MRRLAPSSATHLQVQVQVHAHIDAHSHIRWDAVLSLIAAHITMLHYPHRSATRVVLTLPFR